MQSTSAVKPVIIPSFIVRHAQCEPRPSDLIAPDVDGLCKSCDGPLGDEQILGAHPECFQQPEAPERCRGCGGNPYSCPCTTGYSSTYFTRSML